MKKKVGFLFILIFILSFGSIVNANTINSIKMDINVDQNGDAHVTEIWNSYANNNTEWYHTYKNIGNSQIKDFSVTDEKENVFESMYTWNVNASFENKKNKCGINRISDGFELCFGISEYNTQKTYTLEYTITNFVTELTDAQMIYWNLIDFEQEIGDVYIKIHSDFEYENTLDVWGLGNYGGTAYVYDGYVEMQSPGKLNKNQYMTILIKFPQNTFNVANNSYNYDFEHYLNMAKQGAKEYKDTSRGMSDMSALAISTIIGATLFICIIFFATRAYNEGKVTKPNDRVEIKKYKEYYRDIPCNKNIFRAYYIAYQFDIINNKTDLLGAILLYWLHKKFIAVEKRSLDDTRGEETCIVFSDKELEFETYWERRMYEMMCTASKDGILEKNEFEKWCKHNYDYLYRWFDNVIDSEKDKLINEGIIKKEKSKYTVINMEAFKQEAFALKGLKNYLKDYTLIKDRKAIEVALFEEYLIYAQILGIAKTVMKEFKDLYPEIIENSSFATYENINFIYNIYDSGINSASNARSRASSYSSGGGGFSSGGGGGGSFGGGRRRL